MDRKILKRKNKSPTLSILYQSYAIEMIQPYKSLSFFLPAAFTPSSL